MSRHSRHGRQPHPRPSARPARPAPQPVEGAQAPLDPGRAVSPEAEQPASALALARAAGRREANEVVDAPTGRPAAPSSNSGTVARPPDAPLPRGDERRVPDAVDGQGGVAQARPDAAGDHQPVPTGGDTDRPTCTQAQIRRFLKSRPWIPMHELRRRFGINGNDDDVSPIRVADRTLFIGLPRAEGRMVGELLSAGDVGCELSLDPEAPIIVGLYPMRPVPRS